MENTQQNKGKRRGVAQIPDKSAAEVWALIKKIPNKKGERSFLCCLWLFGNRVSELLGIPPREAVGEYTYERVNKRGKKTNTVKVVKYIERIADKQDYSKWEVQPISKVRIEITTEGDVIKLTAQTLKRTGRPYHTYIAVINRYEEDCMWNDIKDYLGTKDDLEPLWKFSRQTAWYYCNKYLGVPPHKLRALRATRDAVEFNLDAIDLKSKFNWSNADMAFVYASKNQRDIIKKLQKN